MGCWIYHFVSKILKCAAHTHKHTQTHTHTYIYIYIYIYIYARTQSIWQSPYVIINLQTVNGARVKITSCPEENVLRIWGFWKDCSWVFYRWGVRLSFSDLDKQRWIDILNITWYTARWSGVSIIWLASAFNNCVSLVASLWIEARNE